ncbi:phage tail tape measure lambda family domain protein [Acinetobacter sp. 869535]|uniref:hypothetical protein n=1 Tax=Acinetobacter sp. 869535 TaxID=1310621 RepID=UPI00044594C0|nr:hypothetical protein [Acinetobacter sp. 869535]EXC34375.1 phage tail tape measure lambda family domain protein [Acinetobacter sp. 869535]
MAGKLGVLTLDLVARIGQFVEPMNQAERKAQDASKGIADSFNTASIAAKAFGAVVAGASIAGVTAFVNQTINAGNEVQRFSQLANASMAQFQYYAKGAETAGISMESFADKMKDMQDRIGDFQQTGGGPLADFFENIAPLVGVTIQQFQKLSGPEALQLFYDSLEKVGATQNDMKFYMESIISDSSLLIPLLKNGGEGFKKWGDAAQNAGAIMSDSMVEQMVLAKENLKILDLQWQGFQATLVNNAIPVIQSVADNFDAMKSVTMVLGAYWAGTYIPVLIKGTQATYADTVGKASNIIATRSKTLADYEAAKSSLAATAAMVRAMGVINAQTAAMMANARAAYQQAAAAKAAALAGTGVSSVLLGPVGLGIAVASVAAGYLLMRDNGNEANAMLDQQQAYAGMAATELTKLEGAQRRAANESLSLEFETQSSNLKALQKDFTEYLADLTRQYKGVAELERIYGQLRAGTIDVEQAFQMLNQVEAIKTSDINKAADFEKKHKEITSTLSNLKPKLDQVSKSTAKATGEFEKQKTVIEGVKEAYEAYMKTFNADVKQAAASNSLVSNFKLSENEKAEILKVVQAFGYDKAKLQTEEGRKAIDNAVKLAGIRDKQKTTEDRIAETEKKATEQKRLQLEYARKQQIILAGTDERTRNMLKVYQAFMNTGALSDKQARYLTAEVGRENDFKTQNLYGGHIDHNNGAKNLGMLSWQKDRAGSLANSLRSKNLIDSSGNIKQVQEALDAQAAFFVNELFNAKRFAPSKNALLKNADYSELSKTIGKNGIAWDYDGRKINALPHHQKRDGYFGQLNTILGPNPDGMVDSLITSLAKRDDEMYNYAVKIAEDQKEIQERYYTDWQKLEEDNQEKIKDIQEKFANDPAERDRLLSLQQKSYQDDVENWIKTQDEKVEAERQANWRILEARYDLLNSSKAMYEKINSLSAGADDIFAQATMSPKAYAEWSLDSQRGKAQVALGNQRIGVEQDIMSSDTYATDEDRYEALQEAYQQYRNGMAAIDVKYYQDLENLQNQSQAASLAGYGAMFGMMGSMLDAYGAKESTAYKVAFAMQKGFVLSSAILNAKGAIMSAWNDPSNVTMWQKIAGAAAVAVQTNDLMSAIQGVALSGMAHDGIDNIPKEGTWLLDKGERVVDSRTNADLKGMIANQKNGGGNVEINVHVTDSGVSSQSNQSDQKQLGQMIGNAVRAVIRQEQRQGGLLSK